MTTRGSIIASALSRSGQAGSNIDPDLLNEWANASLRGLRRGTGSLYIPVSVDIVAGTARYCAPPLHDIREGIITSPTNNIKHLCLLDTETARREYPQVNLGLTAQGVPTICVHEGLNNILLWPTPNYSLANGLVLYGYASEENAVWVKSGEACPFSDTVAETVTLGVTFRILQYVKDPSWTAVRQQYNYEAALLSAEASTLTPSHTERWASRVPPYGHGLNG